MDREKGQTILRGTWRSTKNAKRLKKFLRSRDDVLQKMSLFEKYFGFFVSFYPTINEDVTIFTDTMDQKNFFHQFGLYSYRYIVYNNGPNFLDEVCRKISLLLEAVLDIVGKTELEIEMTLRLRGET